MENNEISMFMDVKLDIHDKRPDSLKFKVWTNCQVKIEAIKCLPCFLRITFLPGDNEGHQQLQQGSALEERGQKSLAVSINVPGVAISLAASRTKLYSYGLFWTQNRRDCFIYFALETEMACRRHMKWIKKSIKNLELHRQVVLEKRRWSREPSRATDGKGVASESRELSSGKAKVYALGPLPKIPDVYDGTNNSSTSTSWSRRVSRASDIYEEIFEGTQSSSGSGAFEGGPPRLSRRFSRSSIASGIYEEMKPSAHNFNAIVEEAVELAPPLPPLPPPRKRINTYETDGLLGEIPRSNTNPESELAKKKKYKNMLDNIFGGGRSKRAESLSESQACSAEDLIASVTPQRLAHGKKPGATTPTYANEAVAAKRAKKPPATSSAALISIAQAKRNSFSSPDLSKINYLDNFDEEECETAAAARLLNVSRTTSDELELSCASLDESSILRVVDAVPEPPVYANAGASASAESLNISEQIPNNFNFSAACNSSTINLIGANGASTLLLQTAKNKIVLDDLTGYCVMAPIAQKKPDPASSGYSSASSCTNSTEDQAAASNAAANLVAAPPPVTLLNAEESIIYENMHGSLNSTAAEATALGTPPPPPLPPPSAQLKPQPELSAAAIDFAGNLYENLLSIKAAQELETPHNLAGLSTSTPTDSPQFAVQTTASEEESFYQTPRKSIISVDEKVPSYYPNSCESSKARRLSQSPTVKTTTATTTTLATTPTSGSQEKPSSVTGSSVAVGLRQLVSQKMRRERKENLYISSPQSSKLTTTPTTTAKTAVGVVKPPKGAPKAKKTAHKIAENVYAVTHAHKRTASNGSSASSSSCSTNNNNNNAATNDFNDDLKEKLHTELLQLAMLQKIDFTFDDAKSQTPLAAPPFVAERRPLQDEENMYSRLNVPASAQQTSPSQHHLQLNQASNTPKCAVGTPTVPPMMQSTKLEPPSELSSVKKFASLPRFKKIDFSPLKLRINNVLQRNQQQHDF